MFEESIVWVYTFLSSPMKKRQHCAIYMLKKYNLVINAGLFQRILRWGMMKNMKAKDCFPFFDVVYDFMRL